MTNDEVICSAVTAGTTVETMTSSYKINYE